MVHYILFLNKKRRWCQEKRQTDTKSDNFNCIVPSRHTFPFLFHRLDFNAVDLEKSQKKGSGFYFKWIKTSLLLAKMWKVKFVKGLCHPINRTCLFKPGMYLISIRLVKKDSGCKRNSFFFKCTFTGTVFPDGWECTRWFKCSKTAPNPPEKKETQRGKKLFKCILCTSM